MSHLLEYLVDDYNCVQIIDERLLQNPCYTKWFDHILKLSLQYWTESKYKAIWLQLSSRTHLHLVPFIGKYGFYPHHAESQYIMFVKWMDPEKTNQLPKPQQHAMGVGAVIINSQNKLLMVQEITGPSAKFNIWKLPGGFVDASENIADAVIRELREETGIKARFKALCCCVEIMQRYKPKRVKKKTNPFYVRNPSRGSNTKDIYCMCLCEIIGDETDVKLIKQSNEIADIRWFDINDVFKMPLWKINTNGTCSGVWSQGLKKCVDVRNGNDKGFERYIAPFAFNKGKATIYHCKL